MSIKTLTARFSRHVVLFAAASLIGLSSQAVFADYAVKNLDVNEGGWTSYSREISATSSGSEVGVRAFVTPLGTNERRHRVTVSGLPVGMSSVSLSTAGSDCSSIWNAAFANGGFSYEFPGDCDGVAIAKYVTNGVSAGTYSFSATVTDCGTDGVCWNSDDASTATNSVRLNVSSVASLIRARTLDSDADGFLDAFDFFWSAPPSAPLSASNVSVHVDSRYATWLSYPGALSSTWRLSFGDGTFSGWELPRIEISGNASYMTGSYYVGVVEDGASPVITFSKPSGTYTGSISVTLSSSESGSLRYAFWSGAANSSSPAYASAITVNSWAILSAYATDLAGNWRRTDVAYAFVCAVSAPANGTVSAYPGCVVSCNSGYSLVSWACVAVGSSSGGSSGSSSGWSSGGSSGSSSGGASGGSSGWALPAPNNSYALPATLTRGSAETKYFSTLSGALAYLDSTVKDAALKGEYSLVSKKLEIADVSYYSSLDRSFSPDYNRALNAFVLKYVRLAKSKSFALTSEEKADLAWAEEILPSAYVWCQRPESSYVEISPYGSLKVDIYRTKLQLIATPLVKFEKKYVGKFDALLRTATIDEKTYRTAVSWWNGFVLHLTMFRQFWANQASKDRALTAIKAFEPIYKKRVRTYLPVAPVSPVASPAPVVVTVAFPKDVFVWETSEDVRKLQTALKDGGYLGTLSPTGFFWPATKSAMVKFSAEILKIENPEGNLSGKVRDAMNAYEEKK